MCAKVSNKNGLISSVYSNTSLKIRKKDLLKLLHTSNKQNILFFIGFFIGCVVNFLDNFNFLKFYLFFFFVNSSAKKLQLNEFLKLN